MQNINLPLLLSFYFTALESISIFSPVVPYDSHSTPDFLEYVYTSHDLRREGEGGIGIGKEGIRDYIKVLEESD